MSLRAKNAGESTNLHFPYGNKNTTKQIQVFQPYMMFSLLVMSQEMEMWVLQHNVTLIPGERQSLDMLKRIGWNLREEAKLMLPIDKCPTSQHQFIMNIIVWNCGGTLESSFQSHIQELVHNHNLAMLVVMETRVGDDKAREITDRLPFDGAVHTGTIGYAGGLWLLWNSDRVEITPLMSMKQEIHVTVKVRNSNLD